MERSFLFGAAESGHDVEASIGASKAMKSDLRSIGRPSRANPFRGVARQTEERLAAGDFDIQIKTFTA